MPYLLPVVRCEEMGLGRYRRAVQRTLEGIVANHRRSMCAPGSRSEYWIKIKRPGGTPPERFKRGLI